jgi:hypothetical protein
VIYYDYLDNSICASNLTWLLYKISYNFPDKFGAFRRYHLFSSGIDKVWYKGGYNPLVAASHNSPMVDIL